MKKVILMLCAAMIISTNVTVISVYAEDTPISSTATVDAEIQAVGLIAGYYIETSNKNGMLCINGSTIASSEMNSVGFKDIQIWQSSDNQNWKKYNYPIDDVEATRAYSCSISNRLISVDKGYYYCVTCTHYAKAKGLFGSSQSVSNTSNSVWI